MLDSQLQLGGPTLDSEIQKNEWECQGHFDKQLYNLMSDISLDGIGKKTGGWGNRGLPFKPNWAEVN